MFCSLAVKSYVCQHPLLGIQKGKLYFLRLKILLISCPALVVARNNWEVEDSCWPGAFCFDEKVSHFLGDCELML